jgi:XTP/dITP diphosphohydrolase
MKIFLASRNAKKLAELQRILGALISVEVVGLNAVDFYEEPVEDGETFLDNALLKARAGLAATGLPTVADDSGLCVAALNGMPGVLSARWSGDLSSGHKDALNNQLLLSQLSHVPQSRRSATFVCQIVCCLPNGTELIELGEMPGRVISELRGSGGFGYDALFVADATLDGRTSAELSVPEKDAISHRGIALRALAPRIAAAIRG